MRNQPFPTAAAVSCVIALAVFAPVAFAQPGCDHDSYAPVYPSYSGYAAPAYGGYDYAPRYATSNYGYPSWYAAPYTSGYSTRYAAPYYNDYASGYNGYGSRYSDYGSRYSGYSPYSSGYAPYYGRGVRFLDW